MRTEIIDKPQLIDPIKHGNVIEQKNGPIVTTLQEIDSVFYDVNSLKHDPRPDSIVISQELDEFEQLEREAALLADQEEQLAKSDFATKSVSKISEPIKRSESNVQYVQPPFIGSLSLISSSSDEDEESDKPFIRPFRPPLSTVGEECLSSDDEDLQDDTFKLLQIGRDRILSSISKAENTRNPSEKIENVIDSDQEFIVLENKIKMQQEIEEQKRASEKAEMAAESAEQEAQRKRLELEEIRRKVDEANRIAELLEHENLERERQRKIAEENRKAENLARAAELKRMAEARQAADEKMRKENEARELKEALLAEEKRKADQKRAAEELLRREKLKQIELENKRAQERQRIEELRIKEEQRLAEQRRMDEEEARRQEEIAIAKAKKELELERARVEKNRQIEATKQAEERRLAEEKRIEQERILNEQKREAELAEQKNEEKRKLELIAKEKQRLEEERIIAESIRLKAEKTAKAERLAEEEQNRIEFEEHQMKLKRIEQQRLEAEEKKRIEEYKRLEELRIIDAERKQNEQKKIREQQRIEQLEREAHEQIRLENERRRIELEKIEEEKRIAEEKKLEEEIRRQNELRMLEEARKKAEEDAEVERKKLEREEIARQKAAAEKMELEQVGRERIDKENLLSRVPRSIEVSPFDSDSASDDDGIDQERLQKLELDFNEKQEQWFIVLQEFTAKSLRIDEDQDEVDERAQQVEPELRRAIESKNSKLESELTDEWFALISKRDDLLHQAERVSKEKRRVKLEIELVGLRHQANKLAMIDEYRKTQLDYDRENELVVQCMNIVQQKSQLDEEIEEIDEQILLQKELHFKRQQESMDQKAKEKKERDSGLGRMKNWMGFG